jgi:hypothetical protein
MKKWPRRQFIGAAILVAGLGVIARPALVVCQTILSPQAASRLVVVEKLTVNDGRVSGEIRNDSKNLVRDVQLLIRYVWLWKDEFHPGKDDPSQSVYYAAPAEIPPGGTSPFQYAPSSPLPKRDDGTFVVRVSVAGYSEVIMPR